jgi:glutathione peroxidase
MTKHHRIITQANWRAETNRRSLLIRIGAATAAAVAAAPATAQIPMSRPTAYAFSFAGLDGDAIRLGEYAGKPILIVNTASHCGYTPQYAGLQELWTRYRERGLTILGVPSNDFGGQEPGGPAEIMQTAQKHYGVTFPLTAKVELRGPSMHPFYRWAALERPGETPRWNFHKYLIGRDGRIAAAFAQQVEPTDTRVIAAIERELTAR